MTLVLLLLAAAQAASAVPVRLPPQERAADWQEALAIAGLAVGVPGEGPWVELVPGTGTWTVRVRDLAGVVHDARVQPPVTEQDREDLAMLAASLLQPVVAPKPVKVVTPPPPPPKPKPKPVVVEPAPVVSSPPEPVPPPPAPEPEPVPEPAPPPPSFQPRVGAAAEVRPWSNPNGVFWAEVQLVGQPPIRPAVGLSLTTLADLPQISDDVRYWSGELWAGAWYAAPAPLRFDFGVTAGVAMRSFLKDGAPIGLAWIPVVSTRVEVPIQAGPRLVVEPGVHLQLDAREVDLRSEEDGTTRFGDWSVRTGIAFRLLPESPSKE